MVVNGPVGKLVGTAVLLPRHMADIVSGKTGQKLLGLLEKRFQVRVFDPVGAEDLLDDELRVEVNLQPAAAELGAAVQAEKQSPVLRLVVGALPEVLPGNSQLITRFVAYGGPGTGLAGVAPGGPVGV